MRLILLSFAIISALFLGLTVYQISRSAFLATPGKEIVIGNLMGFSDPGPNSEELKKLRDAFNVQIASLKAKEKTAHRWWLIISFAVTGLTAASTLVSSIAAARNKVQVSTNTVVIIAIMTFFATLGNWGINQLSESKTKAVAGVQSIKDIRTKFLDEYAKTADDQKAALIQHTYDKLAEI